MILDPFPLTYAYWSCIQPFNAEESQKTPRESLQIRAFKAIRYQSNDYRHIDGLSMVGLLTVLLLAVLLSTSLPLQAAPVPASQQPTHTLDIEGHDNEGNSIAGSFSLTAEERQTTHIGTLSPGTYQLLISPLSVAVARHQSNSISPQPFRPFRQHRLSISEPALLQLQITSAGSYQLTTTTDSKNDQTLLIRLTKTPQKPPSISLTNCPIWDGGAVTVKVAPTFKDGDWLRDAYSGQEVQVSNGTIQITPSAASQGLLLLESADSSSSKLNLSPTPATSKERRTPQNLSQSALFDWNNATVYFAMTDRFYNGNTSNDQSYGRQPDGDQEIGTFHGGDLAGMTLKLDYLQQLGVNALWITAPYEQVHGWVGGGDDGDFKHYAYHGYYVLDYTRLDANMGTEQELKKLIDGAHQRGIRVLFDIVMNHAGYSTLADMQDYRFGSINKGMERYLPERWQQWQPESHESYHDYHALINYNSDDWLQWWGPQWIRAGIAGYESGPSAAVDPIRGSLAFLPDFKTESTQFVSLPPFLKHKPDTLAKDLPSSTPRQYLIHWLTQWVEDYGIDGFRIDTAKHVEQEAWAELKMAAISALQTWRKKQTVPQFKEPFWMVGEVFGHGFSRDNYFNNGFDALINFEFQDKAQAGVKCFNSMDTLYQQYAQALNDNKPGFNMLSYLSSQDTALFVNKQGNQLDQQFRAAAPLLLLPGAIQIYYGDESARPSGPTGSDPLQGTRSDMNWSDLNKPAYKALLKHWQILSTFRQAHIAIGAGQHQKLADSPYSFARIKGNDRVVIAFAGNPEPF
ncbi:alpha-amylase [Motiliproteus sp. MSK22-1]|uniref:alpha-amylase n=1 Tax=Motiliproteus sp. MSK22-1 TaxID=1897630 RepID=UPI00097779D0|nr:alpha-amylase [Motiliproteus sp. MSK22-1]OMH29096.1 hypothetical protein BGP75_20295 [Motiliproteus sp. MSK22-1]